MRIVPPKRQHVRAAERVHTPFIPLSGGEDLVTPGMSISPGALNFSLNYEPGGVFGYQRLDGFEATDGRPKPSEATYYKLNFDGGTQDFAIGDIVTGGASSDFGEVLATIVTSGTWGGGNAAGYLILFNVTGGVFQDNETITATGGAAVANGVAILRGASEDADDATWLQAAIEATRADIQAVPGFGRVYSWIYAGDKYAFRSNVGLTATLMYKATTSGWALQSLGRLLNFTSGGTTEIAEGNTIVGETSGATALVKRVVLTSGTWAGGDAAGYFTFATQTGTFGAETLKVGATLNLATIAGNSSAISLLPLGRFEFINENFYGSASTARMYGCDGVNKAFEWDNTGVLTPITTGMPTDAPKHITKHLKHLFLSFPNGSVQHSAPGEPFVWSAVFGAAEIGTGDEVTGFAPVAGGVLAIFNRNQTYVLYGKDIDTWELKLHTQDTGAIEWSIQVIGNSPKFLDDRGLTSLSAVQDYGNFKSATFSEKIGPLIEAKLRAGVDVTASMTLKTKDQYRIFFSDGTGIVAGFRGNKVEFTRINLGLTVIGACSGEGPNGEELLLFTTNDGFVYEMDAGTSFNGLPVEAYLRLPFGHFKSPQVVKRFFKAVLDLDAPTGADIEFSYEYDYGNAETPRGIMQNLIANSGGGFWGISEWSKFLWGQQTVGQADGYLDGSGVSMGIFIRSNSTYEEPHTITGIHIHYSTRGRAR